MKNKNNYLPPVITSVEFRAERGFLGSNDKSFLVTHANREDHYVTDGSDGTEAYSANSERNFF